MTAVALETRQAVDLFDRIEALEAIAHTLPDPDERRVTLLRLVAKDLAGADPIRPRIAADLLGLTEKTVRAWAAEGVLAIAETPSSRLLLDVARVHDVRHVLANLRHAGKTTGLLDEVHRRLVDATWLERTDLTESLEQLVRGEGIVRVPLPEA